MALPPNPPGKDSAFLPPDEAKRTSRLGFDESLSPLISSADLDQSEVPAIRFPQHDNLSKGARFFATIHDETQRIDRSRPASNIPHFFATIHDDDETQRLDRSSSVTIRMARKGVVLSNNGVLESDGLQDEYNDDDEIEHRATWNKVVTYKTRRIAPALQSPSAVSRPSPGPSSEANSTPRSTYLPVSLLLRLRQTKRPPLTPGLIFWISVLAMVGLLFGGIFGRANSFGSGSGDASAQKPAVFSLQATPASIALDGLIRLHGTSFTPYGRVGLTRDMNIPLVNVDGLSIIRADAHGSFSTSVFVDPTWQSGAHVMHAEDAIVHKTASFTIAVTGHSTSLRPPHLLLSTTSLNLGTGDQATNSLKPIKLSNTGGGEISWQSAVTQPWLQLSPRNGIFASGQQMSIMIAVDRANLKAGAYNANIIFTTSTGLATLTVQMNVTPLHVGNQAVLQLTPAVLSFTGNDGGVNPPAQVVTVSNPGVQQLYWGVTSNASDPGNWLAISQQAGSIAPGGSQTMQVSIRLNSLLPGVYTGWITFTNQGQAAAMDSPQAIFVSLTVVPQCTVQVQPGALTFTGALQTGTLAQAINIGATQSCASPLHWSTVVTTNNGGSWLSITRTSGVAPAAPRVIAQTTGLGTGTYTGALVFSAGAGTQTVPVTLIIAQPTTPILTADPSVMNFSGVTSQTGAPSQVLTLTNTGSGTLSWHAAATTSVGGAWLAVTPVTGSLGWHESANLTVTASLLSSLIPGTYNGAITIIGNGGTAIGSPLTIGVSFVVQAACTISTIPALTFQGVVAQSNPAPQPAAITARGACAHLLTWTATVSGNWLNASPASGTVSPSQQGTTSIGVTLAGLSAGTYTGQINITTLDSVTHQQVGQARIAITLNVQPPCTLQATNIPNAAFSTEAGFNPAPPTQNFSIGVVGACTGSVNITATPTVGGGDDWLTVSPSAISVNSGTAATFTITVSSRELSEGFYSGSISLAAVNNGITIIGSPRTIGVTLNVLAPPNLSSNAGSLTFNLSTGSSSQAISFGNAGGEPLNWTAALDAGTPGFVSLSATSGSNLAGGSSTSVSVTVDATDQPGGATFFTHVTISATDALTGSEAAGGSISIAVTINIVPPQMHLSGTSVTFTTIAGGAIAAQTLALSNIGGDTLTWIVGTPSATWLSVTSSATSAASEQSAVLTFKVDVTGLVVGNYSATVDILPTPGTKATIIVGLTVN